MTGWADPDSDPPGDVLRRVKLAERQPIGYVEERPMPTERGSSIVSTRRRAVCRHCGYHGPLRHAPRVARADLHLHIAREHMQ